MLVTSWATADARIERNDAPNHCSKLDARRVQGT